MEIELDRALLKQDGKNPITHPIYQLIQWNSEILQAIYNLYRPFHISKRTILRSLRSMYFYKKLFTSGKTLKRFFIRSCMMLSFHYHSLEGHMLSLNPVKNAKATTEVLLRLYDSALKETPQMLESFHQTVMDKKPLNPRFNSTFQEKPK